MPADLPVRAPGAAGGSRGWPSCDEVGSCPTGIALPGLPVAVATGVTCRRA